jgi:hypothetical protein
MSETLVLTIAGKRFTYRLDYGVAPRTARAISERLPLELTAFHGYATGMAIVAPVDFTLDFVENPYVFGADAGSLLYGPNLNGRCLDGALTPNEIQFSYGITRFADWTGWQRSSLVGALVDGDLAELAAVCADVRRNGGTPLTLT